MERRNSEEGSLFESTENGTVEELKEERMKSFFNLTLEKELKRKNYEYYDELRKKTRYIYITKKGTTV